MERRQFLSTTLAGSILLPRGQQNPQPIPRRNRIRQGLWPTNFGPDSGLSFAEMCAEAVRLGAHGFDLRAESEWATMREFGLEPLLAGTGGVGFQDGIIHPEAHDDLFESVSAWIDTCAGAGVETFITIGGQRRGIIVGHPQANRKRVKEAERMVHCLA